MKLFLIFLVISTFGLSEAKKNKTSKLCLDCQNGFGHFINATREGSGPKKLKELLSFYCHVMHDVITDRPTVKFVVQNTPHITPEMICQMQLQPTQCDFKVEKLEKWDVNIHPASSSMNSMLNSSMSDLSISDVSDSSDSIPYESTSSESKQNLKILQISDFHIDPSYKIGSDADCLDPVCCRIMNYSAPIKNRAGRWGAYTPCDMPVRTLDSAIANILETQKHIDIIYVTGDYADHVQWKSSWTHNFEATAIVFQKLRQAFPHTPMYPLVGNHEGSPMDDFSPPLVESKISTRPLYHFLEKEWNWLPNEAKATVKAGGYYTLLIRPGLRLIAINSNVCLVTNWWLLYDSNYPIMLLEWLENTLYNAEQNSEYVHILSHVPTNYKKCYKEWAYQYNRIITRYQYIITAQFNGHSHRDTYSLHFADTNSFKPVNVAWNGGSISTWTNVNSNYKVYEVEPQSYHVIDIDTWIFNLTAANEYEANTPQWFLEYNFRSTYNIPDLSLKSLFHLSKKMAVNHTMLELFSNYYVKQGDASLKTGCKSDCLRTRLCETVTIEFMDDNDRCTKLSQMFNNTVKENKHSGK